ncbi:PP2C family protein-serine/threonine phosphatase [Streptomyces decoyicus]|uniref:PP2C family protein-serine/threonine phosphatase n=1 Tax=Streptomyces decoyicus TaxID=249567 RepID=UPI003628EDA2
MAHLGNSVYWKETADPADGGPEPEESFVTAVVVDDAPSVNMVNCGHPPPLLLCHDKVRVHEVSDPALPPGLTAPSESDYRKETFRFEPGGLLLLHTDGVIEARDRAGRFYPGSTG